MENHDCLHLPGLSCLKNEKINTPFSKIKLGVYFRGKKLPYNFLQLDLSNGSMVLCSDPLMEHFEAKIFPPSQITSANAVPKSVIHLYLNIAPKQL